MDVMLERWGVPEDNAEHSEEHDGGPDVDDGDDPDTGDCACEVAAIVALDPYQETAEVDPEDGCPDAAVVEAPEAPESLQQPEAPESLQKPEAPESLPQPEAPESLPQPEAPESLQQPEAPESLPQPERQNPAPLALPQETKPPLDEPPAALQEPSSQMSTTQPMIAKPAFTRALSTEDLIKKRARMQELKRHGFIERAHAIMFLSLDTCMQVQ